MPDKEGSDDEKKSTKSVVNKKQKQMMGEEGYDVARDMGRVKPSKDKKDATTMPPSKEMEKTRKVNKGPSALERVKKKYKGQIMKMEELDLTQVAKAFGGYIVEASVTGGGKKNPDPKKDPITGDVIKTTQKPKRVTNRMAKTMAGQDIEKMTGDKFVAGPNLQNIGRSQKPKKNQKLNPYTGTIDKKTGKVTEPPVKVTKVDPKSLINNPTGAQTPKEPKKPKKVVKKSVPSVKKSVPSGAADALKDIQKDTKVMGKTMPVIKREVKTTVTKVEKAQKEAEKRSRPKLSRFSGPQMTVAQKSKTFKQAFGTPTGADPQSGKATYMRPGVLTKSGKPAKATRVRKPINVAMKDMRKLQKEIDAANPTFIGASGKPLPVPQAEPGMKGFKGFKKRTQRSVAKTGKQVAKVTAPVTTPIAKFAKASPLATTIAGIEVAKITPGLKRFFIPKVPLPPAPKGGKVGRRTAG